MGDEIPAASGDFQRTFSPVSGFHLSTRPVSGEMRFWLGPRQLGQSSAPAANDLGDERSAKQLIAASATTIPRGNRRSGMVGSPGVIPPKRELGRQDKHLG